MTEAASEPMALLVCGVDEAGRGPLAGNVVAAAVILDPARPIAGLRDSKKLSARTRERLAVQIRAHALDWALGQCSPHEIDRLNILQASLEAMCRAVAGLRRLPGIAHVDGNKAPALACPVRTIVGGDDSDQAIAAASILAKTVRDAQMRTLHQQFPQFGFDRHKGYPTAAHRAALREHGPCPEHRRSFGPVAGVLADRPDRQAQAAR